VPLGAQSFSVDREHSERTAWRAVFRRNAAPI